MPLVCQLPRPAGDRSKHGSGALLYCARSSLVSGVTSASDVGTIALIAGLLTNRALSGRTFRYIIKHGTGDL